MISPPDLLRHLGRAVFEHRAARGWSRRELAEKSGVSERFLAEIEAGRGNPSILKLAEVAAPFGVTLASLLEGGAEDSSNDRRSIALLGLRGAGKSTVGGALAKALSWEFVELDARVEDEAGLTLAELFELHGERYYRRLEREVLRGLLAGATSLVLAAGGGLVTDTSTYDLLKRSARTVWLAARPEDHWARVVAQGDTRPMANHRQAFARLRSILAEREDLYREAEFVVDTSGRPPDAVVEELLLELRRAALT